MKVPRLNPATVQRLNPAKDQRITPAKDRRFTLVLTIILVSGSLFLTRCGDSDTQPAAHSVDSAHVTGPAPDNSSAGNPSLADTNYEKNRTRPLTDTPKKK